MTDMRRVGERRSFETPADPEVTALLRRTYAAPDAPDYWDTLEARVMARVRQAAGPETWWGVIAGWRNAGLVAATLALLFTGALVAYEQRMAERARQLAAGAAAFTVFEGDTDDVSVAFTVRGRGRLPAEAPERYLDPFEP